MYGKNNDEISLKILNTARTLFVQRGVEDVSMYQVAQMTGIGQGTLYRRYASKSKLCLAIMGNKLELFMEDIEEYLQGAKEQPVKERFSMLIAKIFGLIHEDMEWLKAVTHSERLEEAKENMYEAAPFMYVVNKMKELLEEASGRGELVDLDPRLASLMIATSFSPMLLLHLQELGYSSEQIAEEYCKAFVTPLFIHNRM
jgi:AcrR family transcriptional regulator